jgi:hypothetical protein
MDMTTERIKDALQTAGQYGGIMAAGLVPTWLVIAGLVLLVLRFIAVEGPACATAWRTFLRTNGSPPGGAEP